MFVILGEAPRRKSKGAECPICFKHIAWKKDLAKHMIIHTGEKPFVCSVCNKAFNVKSNLNKHQIVHLNKNRQKNQETVYYANSTSFFNNSYPFPNHKF